MNVKAPRDLCPTRTAKSRGLGANAGAKGLARRDARDSDKLVIEEREALTKPLRRKCPVVSTEPVVNARRISFARVPWLQPALGIPCAISISRWCLQDPDADCAAGKQRHASQPDLPNGSRRAGAKNPRGLSPRGLVLASTPAQRARIASSNSATMLVILIIGFTAGPAVSL